MQCPHLCALFVLSLATVLPVEAQATQKKPPAPAADGRLVSGCVDRSAGERCYWLARFERTGASRAKQAARVKSADENAIEDALGGYKPAQPAQINGDEASVLTQRDNGEFSVVSLRRRDQGWQIVAVLEPAETSRSRSAETGPKPDRR